MKLHPSLVPLSMTHVPRCSATESSVQRYTVGIPIDSAMDELVRCMAMMWSDERNLLPSAQPDSMRDEPDEREKRRDPDQDQRKIRALAADADGSC